MKQLDAGGSTTQGAIKSWKWSEANLCSQTESRGGPVGKVKMEDIHFIMPVNKASGKLLLACANGEHFTTATLICRKAGGGQQEYLKILLTSVYVSSFHTGGGDDAAIVPVDEFSLNFQQIEHDYREQKADGSLTGATSVTYNVRQMTSV